jgi:hypothetical protein
MIQEAICTAAVRDTGFTPARNTNKKVERRAEELRSRKNPGTDGRKDGQKMCQPLHRWMERESEDRNEKKDQVKTKCNKSMKISICQPSGLHKTTFCNKPGQIIM